MCVEGITTVYWYVTLSLQKQGFTGAVLAKALNDHGYNVQCAQGLTQLWQLAEAAAQMQQPCIFIVSGGAELPAITMRLRGIHSTAGIVAMLPEYSEASFSQAFLCGVDNCTTTSAGSTLVLAMTNALSRHLHFHPVVPNHDSSWLLVDEAWTLLSPAGESVRLTTTERAFMLALAQSPDAKVSHQELLSCLNYDNEIDSVRVNRLGVLVSRLRRKFEAKGMQLPLKSLHKWGYMFTAPLRY